MLFPSLAPSSSPHFPSSSKGQLVYSMLAIFCWHGNRNSHKGRYKKSYLLIIGSNSSHPGKKDLKPTEKNKGRDKGGFSGRELREEQGLLCALLCSSLQLGAEWLWSQITELSMIAIIFLKDFTLSDLKLTQLFQHSSFYILVPRGSFRDQEQTHPNWEICLQKHNQKHRGKKVFF